MCCMWLLEVTLPGCPSLPPLQLRAAALCIHANVVKAGPRGMKKRWNSHDDDPHVVQPCCPAIVVYETTIVVYER